MSGKALLLAVLVGLAGAAAAQNPVIWSGGIGVDERATAPTNGTKLVFFARNKDFLANVHVVIKDAGGKVVVDTVCPGPWLIVDLAPGTYKVHATVSGKAQGITIETGPNGKKQYGLAFPD